ncbi:hypothetical protein VTO73DRAFT_8771 [Trametes versicolor]
MTLSPPATVCAPRISGISTRISHVGIVRLAWIDPSQYALVPSLLGVQSCRSLFYKGVFFGNWNDRRHQSSKLQYHQNLIMGRHCTLQGAVHIDRYHPRSREQHFRFQWQ